MRELTLLFGDLEVLVKPERERHERERNASVLIASTSSKALLHHFPLPPLRSRCSSR